MTTTSETTIALFAKISLRIIKEQELIIGPVAWDEANKVAGFTVINQKTGQVSFEGDAQEVLNKLVEQYARLFGRASNEVCREAVQDLLAELPKEQIPANLK